jgi:hypothetical protein
VAHHFRITQIYTIVHLPHHIKHHIRKSLQKEEQIQDFLTTKQQCHNIDAFCSESNWNSKSGSPLKLSPYHFIQCKDQHVMASLEQNAHVFKQLFLLIVVLVHNQSSMK